MSFAIPMVRREGKYITHCYFCIINLKGIDHNNNQHVQYPYVLSAIRPISHGPDFPVPLPDGNMEYSYDSEHSDLTFVAWDGAYKSEEDDRSVPLTQVELNEFIRDMNL